MNNNKLSFLDVIKYCWNTWTSSFELYISCWAAYLIQIGATFIATFYVMALLGKIPPLNFFTLIEYFGVYSVPFAIAMITVPIYAFIHLALTGVYLAIVDGKKVTMETFLEHKEKYLIALGAMFIYKLLTIIGYAILVLPGLIAAIFLHFYMYEIIVTNAGIFEAFKKSAQTAKTFPELVFPYVVISYVGTYGIPYFILAPFFGLGSAYIYRKTQK